MKQLYKLLLASLSIIFLVNVAHAQYEIAPNEDELPQDSCHSFQLGCYHYYLGIEDFYDGFLVASSINFKNAIKYFEHHNEEHPQHKKTQVLMGYSNCYMAILESNCFNENTNPKWDDKVYKYAQEALQLLSSEDTLFRFVCLSIRGICLYNGLKMSDAFDDFSTALNYNIDYTSDPVLPYFYKQSLFLHAILLLGPSADNILEAKYTYELDNKTSVSDMSRDKQRFDLCINELNKLVNIQQPDGLKCTIDTLSFVLLIDCYYYNQEFERAKECYEKSGLTPELIAKLSDNLSNNLVVSYTNENEQIANLVDSIANYWYNHYRLLYIDHACYQDKELRKTGAKLAIAQSVMAYYFGNEEYEKALDFWFRIRNNFSLDATLNCYQGWCRFALGDPMATEALAFAAHLNPKDLLSQFGLMSSNLEKGIISSDNPFGGMLTGDTLISNAIDSIYYLFGGLSCYYERDYATAIDNFEMLGPSSGTNLMLAICYQKLAGKYGNSETNDAKDYFLEVIAEEESVGKYANAPYAYLYLDEPNKAVDIMELILQKSTAYPAFTEIDSFNCYGVHYQASEIYAQVGAVQKAKKHFKKAMEYNHTPLALAIAERDSLLTPIYSFVESEVGRYKKQNSIKISPIHHDTIISDIPFKKNGRYNTKTIDCKINGESVNNMLFDPGADYIQLTWKEADRIGITSNDVIGWIPTTSANGQLVSQQIVSLESVEIGNVMLENVQAVISENPNARLLLGCTVWNNLTVEMPSPINKGMIRLTYIKESVEIPKN